jgi:Rrf2 family protein
MNQMLNFTEAANLGVHALAYLAHQQQGSRLSAERIGVALKVSVSHLSKVLQRLARAGLVASTRGAHGGFVLARPPASISLLEIVDVLDTLPPVPECLLGRPICDNKNCMLRELAFQVHDLVRNNLSKIHLDAFADRVTKPAEPA